MISSTSSRRSGCIKVIQRGTAFAAVLVAFGAACSASEPNPEAKAEAAIERSRSTDATYSLYLWNRLTPPGRSAIEEWSAEFHQGSLHRVETPRDRIVANCKTLEGWHLDIRSGSVSKGESVARAACGIHANSAILRKTYEGRLDTDFGASEHLTIYDPGHVRTYLVADNGALLGATISDLRGTLLLENWAVELVDTVRPGIFSPESLNLSAVPDEFRRDPAP